MSSSGLEILVYKIRLAWHINIFIIFLRSFKDTLNYET